MARNIQTATLNVCLKMTQNRWYESERCASLVSSPLLAKRKIPSLGMFELLASCALVNDIIQCSSY